MKTYKGNNIIFRIASSDAISKFKALQAQTFIQLARKEIDFDQCTREIILLEYEIFSACIFKTEKVLQLVSTKTIPQIIKESTVTLIKDEMMKIGDVMDIYPSTFNMSAVKFLKLLHKDALPVLLTKIEKSLDDNISRAFCNFVEIISNYLQYLLVCFHEYNNNIIKKNAPFLAITTFDSHYCDSGKLLHDRLMYFKNSIITSDFTLKNYTGDDGMYDRFCNIDSSCVFHPEQLSA